MRRAIFLSARYFIESWYALSQGEKRFVDLNRFLLALALNIREALSLTASQIYQLKFAYYYVIRIRGVNLFQSYSEDGVRPGWGEVHFVRAYRLILDALMKQLHYMLVGLAFESE